MAALIPGEKFFVTLGKQSTQRP